MIIYICNHYFPDASGFSKRCEREVKALSTIDEVKVICRQKNGESKKETFIPTKRATEILRFDANSEVVERPKNYKGNGLYELKRNADLTINLATLLMRTIWNNRGKNIQLYCVNSPLTVSTLVLLISKLLRVEATLISFHDLEPEMAMHMKNLPKNHWLVKLEFALEAMVCRGYKKILVTSDGQLQKLIHRNKIDKSRICAVPNTTFIKADKTDNQVKKLPFKSKDFVLVYMSTLSFDYTISGLQKFLTELIDRKKTIPNLKVLIIGGGDGLKILDAFIKENNLTDKVVCVGAVNNPIPLVKLADAAFIPWEKDIMTETILPTKLLEFLALGIPVIVPNFGEFKKAIEDKKTGLLFSTTKNIFNQIQLLMNKPQLQKTLTEQSKKLFKDKYDPTILNTTFIAFYKS